MARRLLCLLLATTEAMKTKKTVSKPTSWTYLERFCFSETPEDQEEKPGDPPVLRLKAELEGMRPGALGRRAARAGVDESALEEAEDSDDPKSAIIELILVEEALLVLA